MAAILFLDPKIPNWEYINIISKIQQHLLCEHQKWQSYKKNIANFSKMKQLASSKRVAILDFGKVKHFYVFCHDISNLCAKNHAERKNGSHNMANYV